METKHVSAEELLRFVGDLDFGLGKYTGARIDWTPHMPYLSEGIFDESLKELGDLSYTTGRYIISREIFNRHGCAMCGKYWEEHSPQFILQVELRRDCSKEELVSAWLELGHFEFIKNFDVMVEEGEHSVLDLQEANDPET